MAGRVFIGTSGWHYKHWRDLFYPEKLPPDQMLTFYAQHFDTVEINNTFYHLPLPSSVDKWRDTTQPDFVFAVKGSRFITHMKKLKDPKSSSRKFFRVAERLEHKLGPILFQLPPRWKLNLERLTEFLKVLPPEHKYGFEFRDESWLVKEAFDTLREFNAAFCIHDLANMKTPFELTADFTYVRFHGPSEAKYRGLYSKAHLTEWARRIRDWRQKLKGIYVYFNNDIGGHAVENALTLQKLVT